VADKITQQIIDALSKAAADPAGLPLYAGKAEPGLFPPTTAAKSAAQKCLADGLVHAVGTDARGKAPREQYGLTDKGWDFLLAAVNPKQVLEDFVRVLEARQGEVGELLVTARQMADSLHGLKEAVARVIPRVTVARVPAPEPPDAISPETRSLSSRQNLPQPSVNGSHPATSAALLDAPARVAPKPDPMAELAAAILTRLSDWASSAAVGEDCPLPTLFRSLGTRSPAPTIGEFHDCLRSLDAAGIVGLQPWTGPLYALPEPAYALLSGHSVAYYASAH